MFAPPVATRPHDGLRRSEVQGSSEKICGGGRSGGPGSAGVPPARWLRHAGGTPALPVNRRCARQGCLFRCGIKIAIIGGGPAGLRAAEVAATGGASVTLFDAKPSVGRKFLVAGKGGLNLTHAEPRECFAARYHGPEQPGEMWPSLLAEFDAEALRAWAEGLGVETFAATSGRVYPRELKAAPLLRRWVHRLRKLGVQFALRHRWTGLRPGARWQLDFLVEGEARAFEADAVILALGGGSWPETGSDGAWTSTLEKLGVAVAPLTAANCGWGIAWSPTVLALAEGKPLKNITARAGETTAVGELLVTRYGLEGGAIYGLGPALRAMVEPELVIDFKPAHTVAQLVAKLGGARRDFLAEARSRWKLSDAAFAILGNLPGRESFTSAESLAATTKACALRLTGPRPLAEAISSAGGVRWSELDAGLMVRRLPGVFLAGEMIDWDAPTGGYLMQGCFATGTRAASSALGWLRKA
ncbi:MAG: TIGR03862 family flavoprotein [Verrucomicrobia bacterium]|nr:TIGR03862 family flavoprotein [Verrucomicrobiota bacterium]